MTTSNAERVRETFTVEYGTGERNENWVQRDGKRLGVVDVCTELNRLTERVAELEKERKILIAGLGVYFNVGPCDCEPGVGMICEACTKANEAIEAVNSMKIEGL